MDLINLDPTFECGLSRDFDSILDTPHIKFPSGIELHFRTPARDHCASITTRLNSSDDIMKLLLAANALDQQGVKYIRAFIPYVPYARQDRIMNYGEPFSIKVMTDLINSCNFSEVYIIDPHSDVTPALINNCKVIPNYQVIADAFPKDREFFVVSPDAGSEKKIYRLCSELGFDDIVFAQKHRDVKDGAITNTTISRDKLYGTDCYIVDDICSRGGTFMALAKKLKEHGAGRIYLVVTHYEGSADVEKMKEAGIEHIYKTNSMNDIESDYITNMKIKHGSLLKKRQVS